MWNEKNEKPMSLKEMGMEFKRTKSDRIFKILYDRLSPGLLRYINNIVKDSEKSKDLLSEVMAKAYKSIDMYDPKYHISTWIYRIAYTYACGDLRDKKRKKTTTIGHLESILDKNVMSRLELNQALDNFIPPMEEDEDTIRREKLFDAVDNLDPDLKNIISLRFYEGMRPKQIAESLELPAKEVQKKINEAKRLLKNKMKKQNV